MAKFWPWCCCEEGSSSSSGEGSGSSIDSGGEYPVSECIVCIDGEMPNYYEIVLPVEINGYPPGSYILEIGEFGAFCRRNHFLSSVVIDGFNYKYVRLFLIGERTPGLPFRNYLSLTFDITGQSGGINIGSVVGYRTLYYDDPIDCKNPIVFYRVSDVPGLPETLTIEPVEHA